MAVKSQPEIAQGLGKRGTKGLGRIASPPFRQSFAEDLLTIYGSPLYVYRREVLETTLQRIERSVPVPRVAFHFASVTNGNVTLLQIVRDRGWGLHANTPGDAYLGLQAGFAPECIAYSGSNLNETDIAQLLDWGVRTFNLDSVAQVRSLGLVRQRDFADRPVRLGLRLNLPDLTGDSRIGVRPEEFPEALAIAGSYNLKIEGIHFYRGTGTNATRAFTEAIAPVLLAGQQLPDWRYLDYGGGFGYPYRRDGAAFDWEEFGAAIAAEVGALERDLEIIIEPGRAAIAECGVLLARAVSVKWQGTRQVVGTDTTVANLSVPAVHGGYREIATWGEGKLHPTDLCGNTTYSRDYLGRGQLLPALREGDPVAVLDCGAYGFAMSSHFLHRPRPAEVLVEGEKHRLIRDREDYSVLLQDQIF